MRNPKNHVDEKLNKQWSPTSHMALSENMLLGPQSTWITWFIIIAYTCLLSKWPSLEGFRLPNISQLPAMADPAPLLLGDLIPKSFPAAHHAIVHLADLLPGKGRCTVEDGDQQQGAW